MQGPQSHAATSLSGQPGQSLGGFDSRIRKKKKGGEGQAREREAWGIVLRSVGKMGPQLYSREKAGEKRQVPKQFCNLLSPSDC